MTFIIVPSGVLISSSNAVTASYALSAGTSPTSASLAGFAQMPSGSTGPTLTRNGTIISL